MYHEFVIGDQCEKIHHQLTLYIYYARNHNTPQMTRFLIDLRILGFRQCKKLHEVVIGEMGTM